MKSRVLLGAAIQLLPLCAACETLPERQAMTVAECRAAKVCRSEGVMSIVEAQHVKMGRLSLPGGSCILVSLPRKTVEGFLFKPEQPMSIAGDVYPASGGDDVATLTVRGRRVGWGLCGDFYVFVPD